MEKIVISSSEIAQTTPPPDEPVRLEPKLPPAMPWWAKLALSPLVLVLPLLCVVTVILRAAMRGLSPRTRFAWTGLLATLLSISGLLTSIAAVLLLTLHPVPTLIGGGLVDLDERTDFPTLPVRSARSRFLWRAMTCPSPHDPDAIATRTPVSPRSDRQPIPSTTWRAVANR